MRTSRVVAGAFGVFAAFVLLLLVAPGRLPERTIGIVDDVFCVMLDAVTILFTAAAARATGGRRRAAWTVMTAAMLAWLMGDAIWMYYDIRERDPFPSPADIPYLLYPVLAVVALLLFPTRRPARAAGRPILDGIIVAGSLFIVSWRTVMAAVYRSTGMHSLEMFVSLAYPATAVALLTVAAVVLVRSGSGQRLTLLLLTLGLALSALASGFFSYVAAFSEYASGQLLDIGWVASAVLIIVASSVDRNADYRAEDPPELVSWASVLLPYIPLMLSVVVIMTTTGDPETGGPVQAVALVLVAAVMVRQFLADRENRRLLNTIADRATHDPLTGLANRTLFGERLARMLGNGSPAAVLALDLNGFKQVNDTLGHAAGDVVLVQVAERLQSSVRHGDMVARLGGDEFAILIEGRAEQADQVAARVMEGFEVPIVAGGRAVAVGVSIGIAVAPDGQDGPPPTAEGLVEQADLAMYAKRSAGRRAADQPAAGVRVSDMELMQ